MTDHPLISREIVAFMAPLPPDDPRPRFCAFIADGRGFLPMVFRGATKAAAVDAAETWRRAEVKKERARAQRAAQMSERACGRAA